MKNFQLQIRDPFAELADAQVTTEKHDRSVEKVLGFDVWKGSLSLTFFFFSQISPLTLGK